MAEGWGSLRRCDARTAAVARVACSAAARWGRCDMPEKEQR